MVLLLLPLVAAILVFDHFHPFAPATDAEPAKYGFVIVSDPHPTARCNRFETRVLSADRSPLHPDKVYLYLLRDSAMALPAYGDTIVARTTVEWPRAHGRAYASRYLLLPAAAHPVPLQKRLYQRLAAGGLQGDELATVGALTLGYKEDIDPVMRRRFQASGAAHVLAVSGLHTGILYAVLLGILTLGGRIRPLYENRLGRCALSMAVILCMWAYAWLTGMTPSVVRAVLMVTIVEVGRMLYRRAISINTIAAAAVLILLARPTDLWSVSFQLSFAATAAIVLIARQCEKILHRQTMKGIAGRLYAWLIGTVIISVAAQIGTLPITIHYFGQVSTCFLLTNIIVLPVATFLVPSGLISIALGGSSIGLLFTKITWALAWLMNHVVTWIESFPGCTLPAHADGTMVAVYYLILLLFYGLVLKKRQFTDKQQK